MSKIKQSNLFKIIAIVLITAFIALDISWAYPPEHNTRNSTLATPSLLQQNPMTEQAVRFQQSIFSQGELLGSVCTIGKYLLEEKLPIKYLEQVISTELGKAASGIDLSYIMVKDGIVLIPCELKGKRRIIQIALKSNLAAKDLTGYEWLVSDKYVIKELSEDYMKEPAVSPAPIVETKKEPKATISEPVAEVSVPAPRTEQYHGIKDKIFSVRAILTSLKETIVWIILVTFFPLLTALPIFARGERSVSTATVPASQHIYNVDEQIKKLIEALENSDNDIRIKAAAALVRIGEPAIPALIKALRNSNSDVRTYASIILGKIGEPAIPALIKALRDSDRYVPAYAILALGDIGKPAIPALIKALRDNNSNVRLSAALALGEIGPDAKDALPKLKELLVDENEVIRKVIKEVIHKIEPAPTKSFSIEDNEQIKKLIEALENSDNDIRIKAAAALVRIGEPAIPALIKALRNSNSDVRTYALVILGKIGEPAIPALIKALRDSNSDVHVAAAAALVRIGEPAIPALIKALGDSDRYVPVYAAEVLVIIGEPAIPALIKVLGDSDINVQYNAIVILIRIGEPAIPALIKALGDSDSNVRLSAALTLIKIGEPAISALIETLGDNDRYVRAAAAATLVKIGKPAVPALTKALEDNDINVRLYALLTLGRIGPDAKYALPKLKELLTDESESIRKAAEEAIRKIEPTSTESFSIEDNEQIKKLIKALGNSDINVRLSAATVLVIIGKPAVPALIKALEDSNINVRVLATIVLGEIGPDAKDALPKLKQLLTDENKSVRKAAEEAIRKIEVTPNKLFTMKTITVLSLLAAVILAFPQFAAAASGDGTAFFSSDNIFRIIYAVATAAAAFYLMKHTNALMINKIIDEIAAQVWNSTGFSKIYVANKPGAHLFLIEREAEEASDGWSPEIFINESIIKQKNFIRLWKNYNSLSREIIKVDLYQRLVSVDEGEDILDTLKRKGYKGRKYTEYQNAYFSEINKRAYPIIGARGAALDVWFYQIYPNPLYAVRRVDKNWIINQAWEYLAKEYSWMNDTQVAEAINEIYKIDSDYFKPKKSSTATLNFIDPVSTAGLGFFIFASVLSAVKDFTDTYPVIAGAAVVAIGVAAFFAIWRVFFPLSWHVFWLKHGGRFNVSHEEALAKIGIFAVPYLKTALRDNESFVRSKAAEALYKIGWRPENLESEIANLFALQRWGELEKIGSPAIPILEKGLNDNDYYVKLGAAKSLYNVKHKATIKLSIKELGDEDSRVRHKATETLRKVEWNPPDLESEIEYLFAEKNWEELTKKGILAVLILIEKGLGSSEWHIRFKAAQTLGNMKWRKKLSDLFILPLIKTMNDEDSHVRRAAAEALDNIGWKPKNEEQAIAYLFARQDWKALAKYSKAAVLVFQKVLRDNNFFLRLEIITALGNIKYPPATDLLIETLDDSDPSIRFEAATALDKKGWKPEILKLKIAHLFAKQDWDGLVEIGAPAIPILEKASCDHDWYINSPATEALNNIKGREGAEPLIKAALEYQAITNVVMQELRLRKEMSLKELFTLVQSKVSERLQDLSGEPELLQNLENLWDALVDLKPLSEQEEVTAPAISRAIALTKEKRSLSDDETKILWLALTGPGQGMGDEAKMDHLEFDPLIKALGDEKMSNRSLAAKILTERDISAIPFLVEALRYNNNRIIRSGVAEILGRINDKDMRDVEPLIEALGDKDWGVNSEAEVALTIRGSGAVPFLIKASSNPDSFVRSLVARILGNIKDPIAVEPLIGLLGDNDSHVRSKAVDALVKIGTPAVLPLIKALSYSSSNVSFEITEILGNIKDPRAAELLIKALSDDSSFVRAKAAEALGNIGPVTPEVVPALMETAMNDNNFYVRSKAIEALGNAKDPRAVELIINALSDSKLIIRFEAAGALGSIKDPRAVEPLRKAALSDNNPTVRSRARESLVKIGVPMDNDATPDKGIEGKKQQSISEALMQEFKIRKELAPQELFAFVQYKVPESMQGLRQALDELKPLSEQEDVTADTISQTITHAKEEYSLSDDEIKILWLALTGPGQGAGDTSEGSAKKAKINLEEDAAAGTVKQLFEIVESSVNNERAEFIKAGNHLIGLIKAKAEVESAEYFPPVEKIDKKMPAAEIKKVVEHAISTIGGLEKENVTPEIRNTVEYLKKNLNQFEADSAAAAIIVLARRAKRENQKLIIGLETDWIPGLDKEKSYQQNAIHTLMQEIYAVGETLKSMGLDNVEVIRGNGSDLAGKLLNEADKTHTGLRNIVVMASTTTISSLSFAPLRDADENNRPFLAGIDPTEIVKFYETFGETLSNQLYIRLTQMLYMTLELAAGKEPPQTPLIVSYDSKQRIVIFLPKAEPMDYEALKGTYAAEKTALSAA